jgi:hypothetical protein
VALSFCSKRAPQAACAAGGARDGDLEVGYSARNADEWDRLVGALEVFVRVEASSEHVHARYRSRVCWLGAVSEGARSQTY